MLDPNIQSRPFPQPIEVKSFNGPNGGVESVALENQTLVIGVSDSLKIYDMQAGGFNSEFSMMVGAVAINEGMIVSGSGMNEVKLWNLKGREIKTFKEHKRKVQSVVKLHDMVASASLDGTVKIWNIHGDKSVCTFPYTREFNSVAMWDAFVVAGARRGGSAVVWDLADGKQLYELPDGGEDIAVAINDTKILTGSYASGNLKIWNKRDGTLTKTLEVFKYDGIKSISMNHDRAIIISQFGKTIILNTQDDTFCKFSKVYDDGRHFTSLAMSGDLFAIGTSRAKNAVKVLSLDPSKGILEENPKFDEKLTV